MHQHRNEQNLLLHAVGITLNQFIGGIGEFQLHEQRFHLIIGLLRRHLIQIGDEADELPASQCIIDLRRIGHQSKDGFRLETLRLDVVTVEGCGAGCRLE